MADRNDILLKELEIQWQDHFHMRDQTWKTLQYSILFFLGVVGLEFKVVDKIFLLPAYISVFIISLLGISVALHHRKRQKEKFRMITIYEKELKTYELIEDILKKSKLGILGKIDTLKFIIATQIGLCCVYIFLIIRILAG